MVSRPWQSHAPDAIDALVGLMQAAVVGQNPAIKVADSSWVAGGSDQNVLVAGWGGFVPGYQFPRTSLSEELYGADVTSNNAWEGMGPSILESFSITCASMCRVGDITQMSATRRRAYSQVGLVGALIKPPWLGGTVAKAVMGATVSLHQVQDRRGLLVIVGFSIACEAFAQQ